MPNYADNAPQGYGGDWTRGAPLGRPSRKPESRTMPQLQAEFVRLSEVIDQCMRLKEDRPSRGYKRVAWQAEAHAAREEREAIRKLVNSFGTRATYAPKVTLQRIRLDSGGYDPQGAYWGIGSPLYWAATDDGELDMTFRADDREDAKATVHASIPAARFHR